MLAILFGVTVSTMVPGIWQYVLNNIGWGWETWVLGGDCAALVLEKPGIEIPKTHLLEITP